MRTISSDSVRILPLGVFLFCLIFPLISNAVADSQPASLLNTAQEARESGDGEKAEGFYQQIIENYPTSKEAITAYQELAICRIQLHEIENAESLIGALKTEYSGSPDTVDALYSIAQHYQWNGLPEKAINLHRYNSSAYPDSKKAMWSQGAIIHQYIEQKDFEDAQNEFVVLMKRFKDQPTLPQEVHQCAEKYRTTNEPEKALALNQYNVAHSPTSSKFTMWSQGAIVHHYIRHGDFAAAKRETDVMIGRFSEQPTLPEQLHQIAEEYRYAEEADRSFELHQYNATHSPVSSKYTMQSQGALVHYLIDQKEFYPAEVEYQDLLSRFKDQPTLPQEIYQFAMKYNGVGEKEKALELHQYNATRSPASSKYSLWSQGALIHHAISQKDYEAAQKGCEAMISRFAEQGTLAHELHLIADKYQGTGQYVLSRNLCQYGLKTYEDIDSKLNFKKVMIKILLAKSDDEQAISMCDELLSMCTNNSQTVKVLTDLGDIYREGKRWTASLDYFRQALGHAESAEQQLDAYAGMAKASVHTEVPVADPNSQIATAEDVDKIINFLMTDYSDRERLGYHIFTIGEEYYFRAEEARRMGNRQQMQGDFMKAVTIWEKNINQITDSRHRCLAYYYSAVAYQYMGDYEHAMAFYQQVADQWPGYEKAWNARYMTAECAEKLVSTGKLDETVAIQIRQTSYQDLIEHNPNCPVMPVVQQKLSAIAQ